MKYREETIKISVIIPVFNAQEYLAECLQSVQRQTLTELEILCVNDGSTDNSLSLLKQMKHLDKRIHIFEQVNQGAGAARNLGIKNARGEFVCFLDADDYWINENALERLYESAVTREVNVCGGQYYTDNKGILKETNIYGELNKNSLDEWIIKYRDYQFDYYYTNYIYRRKMLLNHGIFFPIFKRFEDPPFFAKAMMISDIFCVVKVPFYCYRVGYKEVYYTEEMIADQMSGMIENLIFSKEKELKALHRRTYYRIIELCNRGFQQFVIEKNAVLLQKLEEANSLIQWGWLEEVCKIRQQTLRPLTDMMEAVKERDINTDSGRCTEKWPLPIEYLDYGSRIALYGAGDVGRCYFRQIQKNRHLLLCAWVDKNYEENIAPGYELLSPGQLITVAFDYILVGVAEIVMAMDIMDYLAELGIPARKIIWDIGR